MARTIRKTTRSVGGKDLESMRAEFNVLVNEMEVLKTQYAALLAKLDLDGGVTGTDYAATLAATATEAKTVVAK